MTHELSSRLASLKVEDIHGISTELFNSAPEVWHNDHSLEPTVMPSPTTSKVKDLVNHYEELVLSSSSMRLTTDLRSMATDLVNPLRFDNLIAKSGLVKARTHALDLNHWMTSYPNATRKAPNIISWSFHTQAPLLRVSGGVMTTVTSVKPINCVTDLSIITPVLISPSTLLL